MWNRFLFSKIYKKKSVHLGKYNKSAFRILFGDIHIGALSLQL